jgi:hypothetical protein
MPNPFALTGSTAAAKPAVISQTKPDSEFGALAIPNIKPGFIARFEQRLKITKAQREIMTKRVSAARDVQLTELEIVKQEAIATVSTAAKLNGLNVRAAVVSEQAAVLGAQEVALLNEKAAISSELISARLAATFANLSTLNEHREHIRNLKAKREIDDEQMTLLFELVDALFAEGEDAVDTTYQACRQVQKDAFELATKTASEIARSLEENTHA